jgi:hypothetical protein
MLRFENLEKQDAAEDVLDQEARENHLVSAALKSGGTREKQWGAGKRAQKRALSETSTFSGDENSTPSPELSHKKHRHDPHQFYSRMDRMNVAVEASSAALVALAERSAPEDNPAMQRQVDGLVESNRALTDGLSEVQSSIARLESHLAAIANALGQK